MGCLAYFPSIFHFISCSERGLNFCPFVFLGCLGFLQKKIQHILDSAQASSIQGWSGFIFTGCSDRRRAPGMCETTGGWAGGWVTRRVIFSTIYYGKWPILHMVSRTLLNIVIFHRKVINFMIAGLEMTDIVVFWDQFEAKPILPGLDDWDQKSYSQCLFIFVIGMVKETLQLSLRNA